MIKKIKQSLANMSGSFGVRGMSANNVETQKHDPTACHCERCDLIRNTYNRGYEDGYEDCKEDFDIDE